MAIGGLLAIAAAGLLGAVRGDISQANAALALVLIVVLAAFTGGRWAGVSTGIVAAVAFDFFLTEHCQKFLWRHLAPSQRAEMMDTLIGKFVIDWWNVQEARERAKELRAAKVIDAPVAGEQP